WMCSAVFFEMTDEQRELLPMRMLHHVAMRRIAVCKNGSARPPQTAERGHRWPREFKPSISVHRVASFGSRRQNRSGYRIRTKRRERFRTEFPGRSIQIPKA